MRDEKPSSVLEITIQEGSQSGSSSSDSSGSDSSSPSESDANDHYPIEEIKEGDVGDLFMDITPRLRIRDMEMDNGDLDSYRVDISPIQSQEDLVGAPEHKSI